MINDTTVSLSVLLIWVFAAVGFVLAVCIGLDILPPRWCPMVGFSVVCAHGLAMRRWMKRLGEREHDAFLLGRDSVRSIH